MPTSAASSLETDGYVWCLTAEAPQACRQETARMLEAVRELGGNEECGTGENGGAGQALQGALQGVGAWGDAAGEGQTFFRGR